MKHGHRQNVPVAAGVAGAAGDMAAVVVAVAADAVATVVAADVAAIAETEAIAAIVGKRALSRQQSALSSESGG
jgi:hypothetical protein